MVSHPFVTTNITTEQLDIVLTQKLNTIYMVGTKGSGTIGNDEIKRVRSLAEFDQIVGSNSESRAAFAFLRKIDPVVDVYFINGTSTNTTPTKLDNLSAGITELGKNVQLPPGILTIPESSGLSTADINTLFTAAQNLVADPLMNWEYYHNLSSAANTKALAEAELDSLSSPQGHSSAYWGYGKDANGNDIPLSVVAAARTMYTNRTRIGYSSAAAYQENIPFASVDKGYIPQWYIGVDEYTELRDKSLNTIFLDGDGIANSSYKICGARTLSEDSAWRFQNTRYAANNLFYRAANVLKPYLFMPADISSAQDTTASIEEDAITNGRIVLSLDNLLSTLDGEGLFSNPPLLSDGSIPNKYNIYPQRNSTGVLTLNIEVYLVETREAITLSFVKKS